MSLESYDNSKGVLREEECQLIFKNICVALTYFHTQGYVFNDLKPSSIWIRIENAKPFAVLSDFGTINIIGSQNFVGTMTYSSPQMLANPEYDLQHNSKVDVWSLGAVAYFALFGYGLFKNAESISNSNITGIQIPPDRPFTMRIKFSGKLFSILRW